MCGIAGFNWKDESLIAEMVRAQHHRGPDAHGQFLEEGISLGNNRLAVIDLSSEANQPMRDAAGELVIVYNGEIYNFQELKKQLAGAYTFTTKSDTEVILAGYKVWGADVVKRLNGMFAFAIWNTKEKTLFCARDHAGMKPFYYYFDGSKFIFASEISTILTHQVPRQLNLDAFRDYMRLLYVPEPQTLIRNIYKLPPASMLVLKAGVLTVSSYSVAPQENSSAPAYSEAVRQLRDKVGKAVERHLIADVPVGVYLSGGIDSSSVLAAAAVQRSNIKTFSIGFELEKGEEKDKFNQDFALAKKTASHFGAEHHGVMVSVSDARNCFEDVVKHNSDPISNPTAFAMLLLARFAREHVTVALTGNAGDELFGGYERYRTALVADAYQALPSYLRSLLSMHPKLAKLEHGRAVDLFARVMFLKDDKLKRVIAPAVFTADEVSKTYISGKYFRAYRHDCATQLMLADERSWLPDYFFMLSDKMSMAASLEERMPLADRELVTFAHSLPRSFKVDYFGTKKILKDAFRGELPGYLYREPKRGWFSPAAKWLRRPEFSEVAREMLSKEYYGGTEGLFQWDALAHMLERHIDKSEYNLTLLWAILTFQAWARHYKISL